MIRASWERSIIMDEQKIYTNERYTSSSQNSQIRWIVQKVQGEKPPKKARFLFISTLLRNAWEISRIWGGYMHIYIYTRTNECITHGPPLSPAWRTILMATSLQRRLFRRAVKYLMARRDLKKDQGVRIRKRRDEWRNKPLWRNYILWFQQRLSRLQCDAFARFSLARAQLFHAF